MITIDVLRRAGADVTVASVEPELQVTCSRRVQLVADKLIGECKGESFDLIALPVRGPDEQAGGGGGRGRSRLDWTPSSGDTRAPAPPQGGMPGAERLRDCALLMEMVARQQQAGQLYAAICATPAVAFEPAGLLAGKRATAHPAFSNKLANQAAVADRVVVDGTLTTSRGPGTAFEFALALVKQLYGEEMMREVAGPMVMADGFDAAL